MAGPLAVGLVLSAGFYWLIFRGPMNQPLLHRYFAGHPVSVIETVFFFIGLVALVQKIVEVLGQYSALGTIKLPEATTGQAAAKATDLLDSLATLSERVRGSYFGRRLTEALESVERKGAADGLDGELKYLADLDAARQQESYALVRIIIWATPMLGFLGTVMGITTALGDLAKQDMANLQGAMQGLLSGLYVAFDTTAIALSFSMALMFLQFLIDRMEMQVLATVDQRVVHDLLGRFEVVGTSADPQVQQIQRMAQAVVTATEQLVERQAQVWQATIQAAHQHWEKLSGGTAAQMQTALTGALDASLRNHAEQLASAEQAAAEKYAGRFEQWQSVLADNARVLHAQQCEMVRQGEVLGQVVRATGDVVQLERALNENLNALAGSKNFEDMVLSLSAAIHLLTTRLGKPDAMHLDLKATPTKGRAA
jgi:biopolymer transport protein ExbB/TolQ